MQRFKLLGLALLAVLVATAFAAAASQAEPPELLPEATTAVPITFTGTGGVSKLQTLAGSKVECKTSTATGSQTSLKLGKIAIVFKECKELTGNTSCTGLKEKEPVGQITVEKAAYHIFAGELLESKTEPVVAAILLEEAISFTCAAKVVSISVLNGGCVAGEITPVKTLTKELSIKFSQLLKEKVGTGDPDIPKISENLKGTKVACVLLTSVNKGTPESSAQEGVATLKGFVKAKVAVEVLIDA